MISQIGCKRASQKVQRPGAALPQPKKVMWNVESSPEKQTQTARCSGGEAGMGDAVRAPVVYSSSYFVYHVCCLPLPGSLVANENHFLPAPVAPARLHL